MVVDSSALVCILLCEPDAVLFANTISQASSLKMAAPTWLEASLVMTMRKGNIGFASLKTLVSESGIEIIDFDSTLAKTAYEAWFNFGKGRHPAKLNMGDCFSYALAKQSKDVLLFKGNDFSKTDIVSALEN
jgi:ribonuclease VapC